MVEDMTPRTPRPARPWRGRSTAVITAAAAALLVGCTPRPDPIIALTLSSTGDVIMIYELCEGESPDVLVVGEDLGGAIGGGRQWLVNARGGASRGALTLLEVPTGWSEEISELDQLVDGQRYGLSFSSSGGDSRAGQAELAFNVDDLRDLAEGDVLAAKGGGAGQVMSRERFEESALDSC